MLLRVVRKLEGGILLRGQASCRGRFWLPFFRERYFERRRKELEKKEEIGLERDFLELRLLRRGVLVPRMGADWFGR